jgi:RNA polymerase sigma-70 factor (ECF subfamily)
MDSPRGAHMPAPIIESQLATMKSSVDEQKASFEQLVGPHLRRLYRLAFRLTRNAADAEDLLQEVLVALYRRRDELTSIADLNSWLGRVLYNRFVDHRRRDRTRRLQVINVSASGEIAGQTLENIPSETHDTESEAARDLDIRRVQRELEKLSEEHRNILLLHCAEGYSLEEIQGITGIPMGTLKSRLHRARARLKELLGEGTFSA